MANENNQNELLKLIKTYETGLSSEVKKIKARLKEIETFIVAAENNNIKVNLRKIEREKAKLQEDWDFIKEKLAFVRADKKLIQEIIDEIETFEKATFDPSDTKAADVAKKAKKLREDELKQVIEELTAKYKALTTSEEQDKEKPKKEKKEKPMKVKASKPAERNTSRKAGFLLTGITITALILAILISNWDVFTNMFGKAKTNPLPENTPGINGQLVPSTSTPEPTTTPEDILEVVMDYETWLQNAENEIKTKTDSILENFDLTETPYTKEQAELITAEVMRIINGLPVQGTYSPDTEQASREMALTVAYYAHYLGNASTVPATNNIGVGAEPDSSIKTVSLGELVLSEDYYEANEFERAILDRIDDAKKVFVNTQTKSGSEETAEEISEFIARLVFSKVAITVNGETKNLNIMDLDNGIQYLVDRGIRDLTPFLTTILGESYQISYDLAADGKDSEDTIEQATINSIEDALNSFDCTTNTLTQLVNYQLDNGIALGLK